jgi:predicted DNA-binding transcriptional regulator AlpA
MVEIISRGEGRRQACVSRTTEWRLIQNDPDWPRPIPITPGKTGYVAAELQTWIRKRIEQRDDKEQVETVAAEPDAPRGAELPGGPVCRICQQQFERPKRRGRPPVCCPVCIAPRDARKVGKREARS